MIIIDTTAGTIVIVQGHPSVTTVAAVNFGDLDLKELKAERAEEYVEPAEGCPAFKTPQSHTPILTHGKERPPVKASGYG